MRTTVLIVDDHEAFRESAGALLEAEGFHVVGSVAEGASVVDAVERLRPELVLLDIQLATWMGSLLRNSSPNRLRHREWC